MALRKTGAWGLLLLLIFLLIGYLLLRDRRQEDRLIGIWKIGQHDIQFGDNHTYEDRGEGFVYSYGEYSVDFSQHPAWINIIPKKDYSFAGFSTVPGVARGLIRFRAKNEIDLAFTTKYPNVYGRRILWDQRPTSFDSTDETFIITLTRIEK